MKLKDMQLSKRRQFKVEYVSHSPNLRRMQDGNPLHLKINSARRYLYHANTGKLTFFCKRVKRGAHGTEVSH
ncbi:MAG: hypothetical protein K2O28_04015, partial [Clostridia bacterium]|nr:hypothetical protein [Clostridia bacterium]